MALSIITPHYNHFNGIKQLYKCLQKQSNNRWEWLIVDDCSDAVNQRQLASWVAQIADDRIKLITNNNKTNASVCRNKGAAQAQFNRLVFLDADDVVSGKFVQQRDQNVNTFTVYKNSAVIDEHGKTHIKKVEHKHYLNSFLSAKFIWPITSIVWDKSFFVQLGSFNEKLPRLQDIELAIRALLHTTNYNVIDNEVDFYYHVQPIRSRTNMLAPVSQAVYLLVSQLIPIEKLTPEQKKLLSGYYFSCLRYFERSGDRSKANIIRQNLELFRSKDILSYSNYVLGKLSLDAYKSGIINGKSFLDINRKLFKP